jgi:hypothetical protein
MTRVGDRFRTDDAAFSYRVVGVTQRGRLVTVYARAEVPIEASGRFLLAGSPERFPLDWLERHAQALEPVGVEQ